MNLAKVSVDAVSIRRYLDLTEVTQVVQLLYDGTSICDIARRFAVSPITVSRVWKRFQETSRRLGELDRAIEGP